MKNIKKIRRDHKDKGSFICSVKKKWKENHLFLFNNYIIRGNEFGRFCGLNPFNGWTSLHSVFFFNK